MTLGMAERQGDLLDEVTRFCGDAVAWDSVPAAGAGLHPVIRLFDAVATQDTVTLVRSAIRGLLRVCPGPLAAQVRGVQTRDDDYVAAGKQPCEVHPAHHRSLDVRLEDAGGQLASEPR